MKNLIRFSLAVFAVTILLAACSSEKQGDAQTAAKDNTSMQTTQGKAVEQANAVVASLNNPKQGFDPVCGMAIDENAVVLTMDDGKKYGFCSDHCAEQFKADPDKYLAMTDEDDHSGHNH